MACRAISIKARACRQCRGLSLLEYVFALGIGGLMLTVVSLFAMHHAKSIAVLSNMVDLDQANRIALTQMTKDFRQVAHLQSYATNSLTFLDSDGTLLQYTYDSSSRTLTRLKSGIAKVLLRECDRLTFTIRQRNIIGGTFDYYPATTPDTCKVVGVDWSCTRTVLGRKANLVSSQSARIAIRKH
jgi:hypothetical protein